MNSRQIFDEAVGLPEGNQRAAFLDQACGQDAVLRRRVEDLLRAHEAAGSFLEPPPPAAVGGTIAVCLPLSEKPGDKIGRYKLREKIGEGGCGVVYVAEQEEPIRRRVALKVIKLGMDTKSVIARFDAERQALALMDHPNIAKVLDAGATETGRPYFVMELVRGIKITEYCDQNNLSMQERLALFVQVCQAIQHAHQKGIIHRDIKPSNILVTLHDGVPVPKVIDFGIAKATEARLTELTVYTELHQFIGTPAYMSPEQAEMSGLDIDTRSDIYSLGVLLYELLTGQTPFDAKELVAAGLDAMRQTIREKEPPRPSTRLNTMVAADLTKLARHRRAEVPKLISLIRGDLDWVVMKCLEKDRTRRYETANGLARDIVRHLHNEPVIAVAPSAFYTFQKFARRNKVALGMGSVIAGLLVVGVAVSALEAVRANSLAARTRRMASALAENLYAAEIYLAQRATLEGDFGLARRRIDSLKPTPGQPDLRGFEWRYFWRVSQGEKLLSWQAHSNTVSSLTVSPDAHFLASASYGDHEGKLWEALTGRCLGTFPHADTLMFSPEGDRLFASGPQQNVEVWNLRTLQRYDSLMVQGPLAVERPTVRIAVSPVQPWLAVCLDGSLFGEAGSIRIYDYRKRTELVRLKNSGDRAVFGRDGRTLVTGSAEGFIHVWDLPSGKETARLGPVGGISSLALSPNGSLLASTEFWRNDIRLWDLATRQELPALRGHETMVWQVTFSPKGDVLASASSDQMINLWEVGSGRIFQRLQGHLSEVWSLAYAPDGKRFYSGGKDERILVWPTEFAAREESFPVANTSESPPIFDRQGCCIAAATGSGQGIPAVEVRDMESLEVRQTLEGEQAALWFSKDRSDLWTLGTNSQLHLWNLAGPTIRKSIDLASVLGTSSRAIVCPNGGWAAVLSRGRAGVCLANLSSGEVEAALPSEISGVTAMSTSPDSRFLALGGGRTIEILDVTSRRLVMRFQAHKDGISSLAFSPDGRFLGSTSVDNTAQIRSTADWQIVATLAGHKEGVMGCCFAPDGRTFATGCADGTIKLWHLATHREIAQFKPLTKVWYIGFSPDGRALACAPGWGPLRLLRAPAFDEIAVRERQTRATMSPQGR